MSFITTLIGTIAFAILAPIVGCLLAGLDRIISARMQGRVGPPILQPYYDVRKLIAKDNVTVVHVGNCVFQLCTARNRHERYRLVQKICQMFCNRLQGQDTGYTLF